MKVLYLLPNIFVFSFYKVSISDEYYILTFLMDSGSKNLYKFFNKISPERSHLIRINEFLLWVAAQIGLLAVNNLRPVILPEINY